MPSHQQGRSSGSSIPAIGLSPRQRWVRTGWCTWDPTITISMPLPGWERFHGSTKPRTLYSPRPCSVRTVAYCLARMTGSSMPYKQIVWGRRSLRGRNSRGIRPIQVILSSTTRTNSECIDLNSAGNSSNPENKSHFITLLVDNNVGLKLHYFSSITY